MLCIFNFIIILIYLFNISEIDEITFSFNILTQFAYVIFQAEF